MTSWENTTGRDAQPDSGANTGDGVRRAMSRAQIYATNKERHQRDDAHKRSRGDEQNHDGWDRQILSSSGAQKIGRGWRIARRVPTDEEKAE